MHTPNFIAEANPDPHDIAFLENQLNDYNIAVTGINDWQPLAIFVRDNAGKICAGVTGGMWAGYLEVKGLWVAEHLRGQGLGKQLLLATEAEARSCGCTQVLLDTHDFQAPEFYKKLGYSVFGVFEGIGGRYNRYYLRKTLELKIEN